MTPRPLSSRLRTQGGGRHSTRPRRPHLPFTTWRHGISYEAGPSWSSSTGMERVLGPGFGTFPTPCTGSCRWNQPPDSRATRWQSTGCLLWSKATGSSARSARSCVICWFLGFSRCTSFFVGAPKWRLSLGALCGQKVHGHVWQADADYARRLGNTVDKFITRICPGDKAMWDQMTAEAERLCADHTPKSEAVASLIALAGNNPRAFGGIGGRSTKGLHRTTEGQAAPLVERGVVRRKFRHQVPTLREHPSHSPKDHRTLPRLEQLSHRLLPTFTHHPITGTVGHMPVHLASIAYFRERCTPLKSEEPIC